jgi:hypothetical protein
MDALLTIQDVARRWQVSPRTVRRHLAAVPGVGLLRIAGSIRLTAEDLRQIEEQSRCPSPSPAAVARSGTPAGQSASAGKRGRSPNSAQAQLAELLRQKSRPAQTPRHGATSLTVMQGGRDGSR